MIRIKYGGDVMLGKDSIHLLCAIFRSQKCEIMLEYHKESPSSSVDLVLTTIKAFILFPILSSSSLFCSGILNLHYFLTSIYMTCCKTEFETLEQHFGKVKVYYSMFHFVHPLFHI